MYRFRWALAAILTIAATIVAQTSALAQPSGTPPAGFSSWEQLMAVQQRLDAAADHIESPDHAD